MLRFLRELDRCFLIEAERTTAALNSASGSIGVKEGRLKMVGLKMVG